MLPGQQRDFEYRKIDIYLSLHSAGPQEEHALHSPAGQRYGWPSSEPTAGRRSPRANKIDRSPCGGDVRYRTATALVPKTYDLWQSDVTCHVLTWFMTGARPPARSFASSSARPSVRRPDRPFGRHHPSTVTFSWYRVLVLFRIQKTLLLLPTSIL